MAYVTPILGSLISGCQAILVAALLIWLGSLKIIRVLVFIYSTLCSTVSPEKYSSKRSISLFYIIDLEAFYTIALTAGEKPSWRSLYIFFSYLATSAGSVGSNSMGHPPSKCFIPFAPVGILSVFTYI